jgi:polyphosphate kinase
MYRTMATSPANVLTAGNGAGEVIIDCKIDNLYYGKFLAVRNSHVPIEKGKITAFITGHSQVPNCDQLLVAPSTMRARFLALIKREMENQGAGRPARIVAKMNQLEDPETIESLCEAACAGVAVDLVVRGICCLRPGLAGRSEGIRVRSIIGRFLEHSRIFHFAAGHEDPIEGDFYIGSADWMFRNLSRRVEVVTPVTAPGPKQKLWEILDVCLRDQRQAWLLKSDGRYCQVCPERSGEESDAVGTHATLMDLTRRRSHLLAK